MDTSDKETTWSCCGKDEEELPQQPQLTEEEFYREKETNSQARIKICQDCQYLKSFDRCELCGCFIKIKARIFFAHCPLEKW